ncbi:hypothetical protein C7999DRAFT_44151 [Corynascus novoguineensis]|uniref:Uncharacterized protein n=1 Tax=Corynascus novoguineensis TaxID=1126955 RepID=A0AAN7CMU8_9PEZI|nr:hypothetical protein C7999DRAFT_44151 [Corynascus novoguineensis]
MSDCSDSYDSDASLADSDPSKLIEFGLFEHLNVEAATSQGSLKAYDLKDGGSALYSERRSDYSVLADRLLWVDGYETTTPVGNEVKRGREMTLVVLKLVFSSVEPGAKFEHIRATLRLRGHDERTSHQNEPEIEAWSPFRTMERFNRAVAQRETTNAGEGGAKIGYSGVEFSVGCSRENKISWELTDFDEGSSNEEFSNVTQRRNGITWFLKQNKLLNQGVTPEVWVSVLFARPSAKPYVVDFELYVRAGTLREIENRTKRFFGNAPGRTTSFSMTPWKQTICNSEGKDILKEIDLGNLGKLRDPALRTRLNVKWVAGPAYEDASSDSPEGGSHRPAAMPQKLESPQPADKAMADGTAQNDPSLRQTGGTSGGVRLSHFSLDRLAQVEARIAQAEARVAQVEARMALQDMTILQLQQKIMSLST